MNMRNHRLAVHPAPVIGPVVLNCIRITLIFLAVMMASGLSADPPPNPASDQVADEMAKDFYNTYLDNLPDPRVQRRELLETNLVRSLKRIIPGEDPLEGGPAFAEQLQARDITYVRVDRTSPFVRGILKEIPHLKVEEFMFIVRAGPYMAFLCYRADPFRYRVKETDDYALIRKRSAPEPNSSTQTPGTPPANSSSPGGHEQTPPR